jgi:hypothetical protein
MGPDLVTRIGCGPTADTMVPLRGLGRPFSDWYNAPVPTPRTTARRARGQPRPARRASVRAKPRHVDELVRAGLLEVLIENQGVCTWAVMLDGSDDPPVVVEVDSRDSAASLDEIQWQPCAESLSTFMYCRAWDHGQNIAVEVQAQDHALAPGDLADLQSHFSEGPRTYGHPGVTNYRFFTPNSAILIWDGEDDKWRGGQADWMLMATSNAALLDLLRRVWHCGTCERRCMPLMRARRRSSIRQELETSRCRRRRSSAAASWR